MLVTQTFVRVGPGFTATAISDGDFQSYTGWQPQTTVTLIYVSAGLLKGWMPDKSPINDIGDDATKEFLARYRFEPEPVTFAASRPTARTRRPRLSSSRNGSDFLTSAAVGRRFDVGVPGCVGTTFQQRAASSSSSRVRRTIVAVASAGPLPDSWRSDVNGIPETRAPR